MSADKKAQLSSQTQLNWSAYTPGPKEIDLSQVVVMGESVYIGGWEADNVHQYNWKSDTWNTLPPCPVKHFGMTKFLGKLLAISGLTSTGSASAASATKIFSDKEEGDTGVVSKMDTLTLAAVDWMRNISESTEEEATSKVHHFDGKDWVPGFLPDIKIARSSPTVIAVSLPGEAEALAVCGGLSVGEKGQRYLCNTVEVYSCATSQWHQASPLPIPCYWMSSVTIGDTCYLLGGNNKVGLSPGIDKCFSASLTSLIMNAISGANSPNEWKSIATPLTWSTAACLKGSLIAIGGRDTDGKDSAAIYILKSDELTWEKMEGGNIPEPCQRYDAVCLPLGELFIVGSDTKNVFRASINNP